MANDAPKLIAVSLGKIAQARHCKNGLNLRRNLLVAGVLHRARHVYFSELRQQQLRAAQSEVEAGPAAAAAVADRTPTSCYGAAHATDAAETSQPPAPPQVHPEPMDAADSAQQLRTASKEQSVTAAAGAASGRPGGALNKENTPPAAVSESASGRVAPAGGSDCYASSASQDDHRKAGVKRSASSIDSDCSGHGGSSVESGSFSGEPATSQPPAAKRSRTSEASDCAAPNVAAAEPSSDAVLSRPSTVTAASPAAASAVAAVDHVQINNLVQIFNASLTNLTEHRPAAKQEAVDAASQQSASATAVQCLTGLKECSRAFGREVLAVSA